MTNYCSRTILDIFTSSQLFSLLSNLFLYSWNKLSQKYPPHRHISLLKKAFEKCKPVSLFSRFCGTYFNRYVNSTNLQFNRTCNLKLQSDVDIFLDIFQIFSEQHFIRQLWPAAFKCKLCKKGVLKNSQSSQKNACVEVSFLIQKLRRFKIQVTLIKPRSDSLTSLEKLQNNLS